MLKNISPSRIILVLLWIEFMNCLTPLTTREREKVAEAMVSGTWDDATLSLAAHAETCVDCNGGVHVIIDTVKAWQRSEEGKEFTEKFGKIVEGIVKGLEDS